MSDLITFDQVLPVPLKLVTEVSSTQPGFKTASYVRSSSYNSNLHKSGIKNPAWRDQIRRGVNAGTAYTRSSLVQDHGHTSGSMSIKSGSYIVTTDVSGNVMIGPGPVSAQTSVAVADQAARLKFYANLRKAQYDLGGQVLLAEFRQTLAMVRRPFKTLRDSLKSRPAVMIDIIRRARHRKQAEKALADSWLEFSFGMLPLLSDIQGATKALASLHEYPRRVTVTGKGKHEWNWCSPTTLSTTGQSCYYYLTTSVEADALVRYKAALKGEVFCGVNAEVSKQVDQVTHRLGLTASEFIPTLYEALPWSFFVDYFSTVGAVVNAWGASHTDLAWVVRSEKSVARTKSVGVWKAPMHGNIGNSVFRHLSYFRSIPSDVSLPDLAIEFNVTPWKALNIVALRKQMTTQVERLVLQKGW